MKFNLEESVTGADLKSGATLLFFPRSQWQNLLELLTKQQIQIDAFSVNESDGVLAFFPDESTDIFEKLPAGVTAQRHAFRLTIKGQRLTENVGLAALWKAVLTDARVPLPLSCADCNGVTHYLPEAFRPTVLQLLHRTFGISAV